MEIRVADVAIFEWAHLDLRVGFVFLQRFSRCMYLNSLVK